MKKISLLFIIPLLLGSVISCKKDHQEISALSLTLQVSFDVENTTLGLSPENTAVTIKNLLSGKENKAKADASGKVFFESIAPGDYTILSTLTITAEQYSTATGAAVAEDVVFNASLNTTINTSTSVLPLTLKAGVLGDWVIKQVYYAGSHTSNGAVYRDQFIEIYNNSNEVLYADSLHIALISGVNNNSSDLSKSWFLPNGQYDWTKAYQMNNPKANTDYVYANTVYMFPGTGKQYPVQPGSSIILAQNAINHKIPFINSAGKEYSVKDPSLTIDLSGADYEAYLGDISGISPLATDYNNPNVTNIKVIHFDNRDMILDALGRTAFVIFKTEENVAQWAKYAAPNASNPATADLHVQIPNNIIIDAVEITQTVETKRHPKRLADELDASYTYVPGGSYSSQSVIRKTSKVINGRRILKDSNNSASDFDYLTLADATKSVFK